MAMMMMVLVVMVRQQRMSSLPTAYSFDAVKILAEFYRGAMGLFFEGNVIPWRSMVILPFALITCETMGHYG